ncbi:MAG: hypothetical protein DMF11_01060, partial [Verrucomicrobia bacterium]
VGVAVAVVVGVNVAVSVAVGVGVRVAVGVAVDVAVGVGLDVAVAVAVAVAVGVGVGDGQLARMKFSCKPSISPPVLHSYCVKCEPVSRCAPTVAPKPSFSVRKPYTNSKFGEFSCRRISKSRGTPLEQQRLARHSILKMRLGAVPVTEVNMP